MIGLPGLPYSGCAQEHTCCAARVVHLLTGIQPPGQLELAGYYLNPCFDENEVAVREGVLYAAIKSPAGLASKKNVCCMPWGGHWLVF